MFSQVTYQDSFNGNNSPAKVNRQTKHLYINRSRWREIKPEHRVFILLHEYAHCALNSSDELAVDALAHQWYVEMGYPLTESIKALTRILHDSTYNNQRVWNQYQRAVKFDKVNEKTDNALQELQQNPDIKITAITESFDGEFIDVEYFDMSELDDVPTMSRKQMRKKKKSIRLYKRLGRSKKKHAVANDVQAGADTRKIYAEKGIYVPTRAESISKGVGQSMQAIAGAVGGAMGLGGGSGASTEQSEPEVYEPGRSVQLNARLAGNDATATDGTKPRKQTKNNTLYIGIGVGVLVLGLITFLIAKK